MQITEEIKELLFNNNIYLNLFNNNIKERPQKHFLKPLTAYEESISPEKIILKNHEVRQ